MLEASFYPLYGRPVTQPSESIWFMESCSRVACLGLQWRNFLNLKSLGLDWSILLQFLYFEVCKINDIFKIAFAKFIVSRDSGVDVLCGSLYCLPESLRAKATCLLSHNTLQYI